jgi:hypothetical protein
MVMQTQNGTTQNLANAPLPQDLRGQQEFATNAVTLPSATPVVSESPEFESWTSSSRRLSAIVQVSRETAGELPSFESYVEQRNQGLPIDSVYKTGLASASITPSELNYFAKISEAEDALAQAA